MKETRFNQDQKKDFLDYIIKFSKLQLSKFPLNSLTINSISFIISTKDVIFKTTKNIKIITIDKSELDRRNFTNMISFANTAMDISSNHSKKGKSSPTEIRASKDPTAFLQLLFDRITYQWETTQQITKHYHDEIRWDNSKSCFRMSGLLFFLKAVVKHTLINTLQDGEMKYKQFIIDMLLQSTETLRDNMLHWANIKITRKIKKFKQLYNNTYFDDKLAVINESKINESPSILHINNLALQDCKFDIDIDVSTLLVIINGEKHNEYDEKNKQYKAVIARNNPYNFHENCLRNKMSRNNTRRNRYLCNYHEFEDQQEKDRDIEISCHERMLPNSEGDKKKLLLNIYVHKN